jgi:hypothetical protein
VRFQGKSRLGFYPLPLPESQRIRRFLSFPDQSTSAVDPCVGDGAAFEAITSAAGVLRYGIELDAFRAEQARQRIPNVIQGNTLEVQCAVECFGLLYSNPPYDWTPGPADNRRTEPAFLTHTYRWLNGTLGSTMNSPAEGRSNRLLAWDALLCWSEGRKSCS